MQQRRERRLLLHEVQGLIDLEAEKARLEKEIKSIEAEIGKCNGKLGTATFVANAPAAVERLPQLLDQSTKSVSIAIWP